MLFCAECGVKNCAKEFGKEVGYPGNCPSLLPEHAEYLAEYRDPTDALIARVSAECGPVYTEGRVEKTIRFAKLCGYRKLGVAFCITLAKEAELLCRMLKAEGFEVESLICKVGHIDRGEVGVPGSCSPMCNPIAQAEILNRAGTELNIAMGLCVGHDAMFSRHSNAPVTVLVAKDHKYHHAPMEFFYEKQREE